jgi:hypothetical protein
MKQLAVAIGAAWLLAAQCALAEPAVTIRAVDLKAQPTSDAKTVVSLPVQSTVDVVTRQGAWVHLKSGRSIGWAKIFDIRMAGTGDAATAKKTGSGIADTLGLAMGNRGSSVTTGVRGLDADMLKAATPNPAEYAKLASYARSKEQAGAFARAGNLKSREVPLLGGQTENATGAKK